MELRSYGKDGIIAAEIGEALADRRYPPVEATVAKKHSIELSNRLFRGSVWTVFVFAFLCSDSFTDQTIGGFGRVLAVAEVSVFGSQMSSDYQQRVAVENGIGGRARSRDYELQHGFLPQVVNPVVHPRLSIARSRFGIRLEFPRLATLTNLMLQRSSDLAKPEWAPVEARPSFDSQQDVYYWIVPLAESSHQYYRLLILPKSD